MQNVVFKSRSGQLFIQPIHKNHKEDIVEAMDNVFAIFGVAIDDEGSFAVCDTNGRSEGFHDIQTLLTNG